MKNNALRVVNLLLYVTGCFLVGSGFLLAWRLPPGSRGGRGLTMLGMNRHEWGDWHLYVSFAVIVLTILHLALNRAWLEKIAASRKTWRLVGGLVLGLALVAAFMLAPVRQDGGGGRGDGGGGGHRHGQSGH